MRDIFKKYLMRIRFFLNRTKKKCHF